LRKKIITTKREKMIVAIEPNNQARQFFDLLFAAKEPSEYICIWTLADKRSAWFKDLGEAADYVSAHRDQDVYVGVGLSPKDHGPNQRLKIEGAERLPSSLVGLWADIDILNPTHGKQNLPPDEASARSILFANIPPTVIVRSGGGLQAWWLFKEPFEIAGPDDVDRATALAKRWNRALRAQAAAKGWDLDQVGDLARVLRVPATTNCKLPGTPRPVTIAEFNDRRYNASDLEEYLDLIGAGRDEMPTATRVTAPGGALKYDAMADVDAGRFTLLYDADLQVRQSWDHQRSVTGFPDQSLSAYDQSLANLAAQAGWPDQDIVNLLIAHRRKYKDPKLRSKLRDSYFLPTIRKARELSAGHAPSLPVRASHSHEGRVPLDAVCTIPITPSSSEVSDARGSEPELFAKWQKCAVTVSTTATPDVRRAVWQLVEFDDYLIRHHLDSEETSQQGFARLDRLALELWLRSQFDDWHLQYRAYGLDPPVIEVDDCPSADMLKKMIQEAANWMCTKQAAQEAASYLDSLLEEAIHTGKSAAIYEAEVSLTMTTNGHFADFKAAAAKAAKESRNGLRVDLKLLNKTRSDAIRRLRPIVSRTPAHGAKPVIVVNDRQLPELRKSCVAAVQQINKPPFLFQRLRDIVRLRIDPSERKEAYLEVVTAISMTGILADAADFYYVDPNGLRGTPPPRGLSDDILTYDFVDPVFPFVEAITRSPVVRMDGSILAQPGYDAATSLIYHPPAGFELPPVPIEPTQREIQAAKDQLDYLTADFNFIDKADRTNFIAYCLTPLMRHQMNVAPLCIFDSPVPGSGKGLLVDLASIIATGEVASITTIPKSQEEWPKTLHSLLTAGRTFIIFDNVRGVLESDALEAVLTTESVTFRVLGFQHERTVPNRATWAITGNNVTVGRDMARRCFRVCIDPQCSQPFLRKDFREHDLHLYCKTERHNLLHALLVLIRAWYAAGKPDPGGNVQGTYNSWRRIIGGILKCSGFEGFLSNQRKLFGDMDVETESWEAFLLQLQPQVQRYLGEAGGFTVANVVPLFDDKSVELSLPREVAEIYNQTLSHDASKPNRKFSTKLGLVFRAHSKTRYGASEVYLEQVGRDEHSKVARYMIGRGKG
jgi:hypothetical protein